MTTPRGHPPSAAAGLVGLKDFQRRTVEYAFRRLYQDADSTHRLVADEVGLGKTMVARGVIAKAAVLVGFWSSESTWCTSARMPRLLARTSTGCESTRSTSSHGQAERHFFRSSSTTWRNSPSELRLDDTRHVAGAPRRHGIAKERAVLFAMLCAHLCVSERRASRPPGGVKRDNFRWWATDWMKEQSLDEGLRDGFLAELDRLEAAESSAGTRSLRARFLVLAELAGCDRDIDEGLWDERRE